MAKTHGLSHTPEYWVWRGMKQRCTDPKRKDWPKYGGRGITVDPRWNDFRAFLRDMGPRPEGMTLGRIDNEQGYSPENCRWETHSEQNLNRRPFRGGESHVTRTLITANGRTQTLIEWARELGVKPPSLLYRLRAGWTPERIVNPTFRHGLRRK